MPKKEDTRSVADQVAEGFPFTGTPKARRIKKVALLLPSRLYLLLGDKSPDPPKAIATDVARSPAGDPTLKLTGENVDQARKLVEWAQKLVDEGFTKERPMSAAQASKPEGRRKAPRPRSKPKADAKEGARRRSTPSRPVTRKQLIRYLNPETMQVEEATVPMAEAFDRIVELQRRGCEIRLPDLSALPKPDTTLPSRTAA